MTFGRGRVVGPIQILINYGKKVLNWLRTICVASITTVATRHTRTVNFWTDFEHNSLTHSLLRLTS